MKLDNQRAYVFFDKVIDKLPFRSGKIISSNKQKRKTRLPDIIMCTNLSPDRSNRSDRLKFEEADKVSHRTSFYSDSIESESCNACWLWHRLHLSQPECSAHNWMHFLILHKWKSERENNKFFPLSSACTLPRLIELFLLGIAHDLRAHELVVQHRHHHHSAISTKNHNIIDETSIFRLLSRAWLPAWPVKYGTSSNSFDHYMSSASIVV